MGSKEHNFITGTYVQVFSERFQDNAIQLQYKVTNLPLAK